ncbi:adenylate kinase [Tenuifilum osseticum]|uniref:adenylate kinase n=1 Tax=Tenuifilum osseticum TaxID=3374723 RepID=UPI0034E595FF
MLNIVLFGPPGAGKGTQSQKIIEKYKLQHLATGDMLRAAIREQSPIGVEAQKYIDKGQLVPDEMVINLITGELDNHHDVPGFVFDGFPRTTVQAKKLDEMLDAKKAPITIMLALEVEYDQLLARLLNRGKMSDRSDDQDEGIIRGRLDIYNKTTLPVMDYYKAQGKYRGVNGMGTIDEIFERICQVIDSSR